MKEVVDINILGLYVDTLINRCKVLYGLKDTKTIATKLGSIKGIYITDELPDTTTMSYSVNENSIYINKKIVKKDVNGKYLVAFDEADPYFKHALIHELLHVASRRENGNGIMGENDGNFKIALNEGITQMIADEICGYYENKFLGSYNFEKIIAHIIRMSIGNEALINSYFYDPKLLKSKIDSLSSSFNFYSFLNSQLSIYHLIKDETKLRRKDEILRLVVINMILPVFRSLDKKGKEDYLTSLLFSISGDQDVKNTLIGYIHKYLGYSDKKINKENTRIIEELLNLYQESNVMKELPNLKKIFVKDNGSIYMLKPTKQEITLREDKEKVYKALFDLNGYNNYLTPNVIASYIDSIINGRKLKINDNSVLKRRIIFCGIKEALLNEGYYILNDYEELDKTKDIEIKYISKKVGARDYKTICETFSICKTEAGNNNYVYSIVYNSTKNELEDEILKKLAFFAINWMISVQDNGRKGIDEAFNVENLKKFYSLITLLCNMNENYGYFNADIVEKYALDKELVRRMLKTPIQMEWVYDYIDHVSNREVLSERKGLSFDELNQSRYHYNKSVEEAKEIVSKNK